MTSTNHEQDIGRRIAEARRGQMTQVDLADAIGVHKNTVVNWENGRSTPKSADLDRIAEALGMSTADLVGETAGPSKHEVREGARDLSQLRGRFLRVCGERRQALSATGSSLILELMWKYPLSDEDIDALVDAMLEGRAA